jgi:hypothetical protein
MPEHKPFNTLAEEFNAACGSWVETKISSAALLARYALLMRHCAENDEQKRELTEKLFDTTLIILSKPLKLGDYQTLSPGFKNHASTALEALSHESAIAHLTKHAPRDLANVALAVLDHAEVHKLDTEEKVPFHDYANMMLGFADSFAKAIAARTYETATSQSIATKPITLKPKTATPE